MAILQKWDFTGLFYIELTHDMASCAAGLSTKNIDVTTTDSTYPLMTTDVIVAVIPPAALTTGLTPQSARVVDGNTIAVIMDNNTAGAIDPSSGTWGFVVARR